MKAAVVGHPVAHSKSPTIHQYWMKQYEIDGTYETVDIDPSELEAGIKKLIVEGYDGFNVTVPHKEFIIKLCDEIDGTAQAIGAVNTVKIQSGKLYGYNTDAFGFLENLKSQVTDFKGKKALILGAGGASRAAVYALIEAGIEEILLTNRTIEKAGEVQKISPENIEVIEWVDKENFLENVNLLVNTTSLGMGGKPELEIDLSLLSKNAVVNDIVYAPLETQLLQQAAQQGNNVVTGIGMLIHQARPAFEAWTGVLPDVTDDLIQEVLA